MSDDLIIKQALPEKNIDKIKVSSAEIVVSGTKDKPYYEIKYSDLSDNEIHIGYGSYDLGIVFEYLEKYFEIVNEEVDLKQIEANDDLISRKAVIKAVDKHTRDDGTLDDDISIILEEVKTVFDKEKVIKKLKHVEKDAFNYYNRYNDEMAFGESAAFRVAIEIVKKGGIE